MDQYRIAKHAVSAQVRVIGQPTALLRLFLSAQARTHDGSERLSDLLNGTDAFFPAVDQSGVLHILRRDAVVIVSVLANDEAADLTLPQTPESTLSTTRADARVILDDGTTLAGVIEYAMPEARARLQDYMNSPDVFLSLRQDGMFHLINKLHITRVDALEGAT